MTLSLTEVTRDFVGINSQTALRPTTYVALLRKSSAHCEVVMFLGIIFLFAGILIAIYPPLLSFVVAGVLIFIGISLISISYHYKRMSKHFDNPFFDFFARF